MTKEREDIIDVPFTEVKEEEIPEGAINLDDVGYMVMVGRTKDGKTFFRTVGLADLVVVDGLLDLATLKVKEELKKHLDEI